MTRVVGRFKREGAGSCELDGDRAHAETGDAHGADPRGGRLTACLLAEFLAVAVEVFGRVGGGAAIGAAPDRPGLLHLGCDRSAQPAWSVLYRSRRPSVALHL